MNRKDFLKAAVGVIAAPFVVKEVYGSVKGCIVLNSGGDRIAPGAFELPKPKTYPVPVKVNPIYASRFNWIDLERESLREFQERYKRNFDICS